MTGRLFNGIVRMINEIAVPKNTDLWLHPNRLVMNISPSVSQCYGRWELRIAIEKFGVILGYFQAFDAVCIPRDVQSVEVRTDVLSGGSYEKQVVGFGHCIHHAFGVHRRIGFLNQPRSEGDRMLLAKFPKLIR